VGILPLHTRIQRTALPDRNHHSSKQDPTGGLHWETFETLAGNGATSILVNPPYMFAAKQFPMSRHGAARLHRHTRSRALFANGAIDREATQQGPVETLDEATVDQECTACDPSSAVGSQERHNVGYIVGHGHSAERRRLLDAGSKIIG
jgi:hypothetical protein